MKEKNDKRENLSQYLKRVKLRVDNCLQSWQLPKGLQMD